MNRRGPECKKCSEIIMKQWVIFKHRLTNHDNDSNYTSNCSNDDAIMAYPFRDQCPYIATLEKFCPPSCGYTNNPIFNNNHSIVGQLIKYFNAIRRNIVAKFFKSNSGFTVKKKKSNIITPIMVIKIFAHKKFRKPRFHK